MNPRATMRAVQQRGTAHAAPRHHHLRPAAGGGFCQASRQGQPIRRRTLETALLGMPSLLLLPSVAAAAPAPPRAAAEGGSGHLHESPASSLEEPATGNTGGRPEGRSVQGSSQLDDRAQRNPSEAAKVDGGTDREGGSGSESDSSSSSSSSDEEGEQRRPPAARRKPQSEAARHTEEQLRAQMKEDKRRAKEQEKAAKAARKEEKRHRKEAKQVQAATATAKTTGVAAPADSRRHSPSELAYPAAAGDAALVSEDEEERRQLSWLLGQLLQ